MRVQRKELFSQPKNWQEGQLKARQLNIKGKVYNLRGVVMVVGGGAMIPC